jgi:hypothetical protein
MLIPHDAHAMCVSPLLGELLAPQSGHFRFIASGHRSWSFNPHFNLPLWTADHNWCDVLRFFPLLFHVGHWPTGVVGGILCRAGPLKRALWLDGRFYQRQKHRSLSNGSRNRVDGSRGEIHAGTSRVHGGSQHERLADRWMRRCLFPSFVVPGVRC